MKCYRMSCRMKERLFTIDPENICHELTAAQQTREASKNSDLWLLLENAALNIEVLNKQVSSCNKEADLWKSKLWEAAKRSKERCEECEHKKTAANRCWVCSKELNEYLPTLESERVELQLVKRIPLQSGREEELRITIPAVYCPYCGGKIK